MKINLHVDTGTLNRLSAKFQKSVPQVEHNLANHIAKDTEPFVPMVNGGVVNGTRIEGNVIIYPGPYSQYLYYGKVMVNIETGKGPSHFVNEYGEDVIFYREGTKLRASDRDLVFTKSKHPDAQAHWMEASKAVNMEQWREKGAEELETAVRG